MRRVRYPLFFPRRCVLPWAKAARLFLCRSQGKRRRQALCRRVEIKPTWNWASDNAVFTLPCRSCGTAISAPSLRLPLFRHAMFPSAFQRQVRRLTSGTFLRFPGHLCGDMRLAVAAHAHLFWVATCQHLRDQTIVVRRLITGMGALKRFPVIGKDLLEDTPVPRGWWHHQIAPSRGHQIVAVKRLYHALAASSTPHRPLLRDSHPPSISWEPRGLQDSRKMHFPIRSRNAAEGIRAHPTRA